jgi:predicted aspartyl protease
MNRRTLLIRTAGLLAVAGGAWWARDNLLWPKPELVFGTDGATPWLPYVLGPSTVSLNVRLGDTLFPAMIDTGAQRSVIDSAFYRTLPDSVRPMIEAPLLVYGVGGGATLGRGVKLDLDLPGLAVRGLRMGILDLGGLAFGGVKTAIILGQDVLSGAVLAMDPARRYVRLIRRDVFVRPPDLTPFPVRLKDGGLVTDVTVEGTTVEAMIDTGASGLLGMSRDVAERTGLLDGRPAEQGHSVVLGGRLKSTIIEARAVTFADQTYKQASVYIYERPPLPTGTRALVGIAAFEGRRAALDLGEGTLHISRQLDLTID